MNNSDISKEYQEEENLWNEFIKHSHRTIKFKFFLTLAWLLALFCMAQLLIIMVSLTPRLSNLSGIQIKNFFGSILLGIIVFFATFITALLVAGRADKIRRTHFENFKKSKLRNG